MIPLPAYVRHLGPLLPLKGPRRTPTKNHPPL
jgi:hypothetical protein